MRHLKAGRKFGRNTSHRRAMFKNLAANLVLHERIETTEAKAKELRRIVERMITKATRLGDDLTCDIGKLQDDDRARVLGRRMHVQRTFAEFLPKLVTRTLSDGTVEDVDVVHKLFHEIAPRFMERVKEGKGGGYTRILLGQQRRGDGAKTAFIELLGRKEDTDLPKEDTKVEGKTGKKKGAKAAEEATGAAPAAEQTPQVEATDEG